MRKVLASDLLMMKGPLLQTLILGLIVGLVLCVAMGSPQACAAALAAMVPLLLMVNLWGFDETAGWSGYRLTLPVDRSQVVAGRYGALLVLFVGAGLVVLAFMAAVMAAAGPLSAVLPVPQDLVLSGDSMAMVCACILLGLGIDLVAAALSQPLVMRFGMTKAMRFIPLLVVMAVVFGISFLSASDGAVDLLGWALQAVPDEMMRIVLIGVGLLAVGLILFALSGLVAARLYAKRQF